MTVTRFDRVRPRAAADSPLRTARDSEGKRALFSTARGDRPGAGSVVVECSRCDRRTVLAPFAAIRAAFPSLHLAIGVGRGERESTLGLPGRRHGSLMRCPACGRVAWVRLTVRL